VKEYNSQVVTDHISVLLKRLLNTRQSAGEKQKPQYLITVFDWDTFPIDDSVSASLFALLCFLQCRYQDNYCMSTCMGASRTQQHRVLIRVIPIEFDRPKWTEKQSHACYEPGATRARVSLHRWTAGHHHPMSPTQVNPLGAKRPETRHNDTTLKHRQAHCRGYSARVPTVGAQLLRSNQTKYLI
jgi:hypothetical protein